MAGGPGFWGDKVSAVSPWVSPDLSCSHQGLWSTSMVFPGCPVGSSIPCQSRFAAVLVRILPALLRAGRGWSTTELRLRVQGPCETWPAPTTMPPEKGSHTLGSQLKTWFTPMQNAASINQGAVTRCPPWSSEDMSGAPLGWGCPLQVSRVRLKAHWSPSRSQKSSHSSMTSW